MNLNSCFFSPSKHSQKEKKIIVYYELSIYESQISENYINYITINTLLPVQTQNQLNYIYADTLRLTP